MGVVEKEARKMRRLRAFQKAMLVAVLAGVMVATGAVPNTSQILKYFRGYKKGARFNYQAKNALGRLAKSGLVIFEERDGMRYARVTDAGEQLLALESMREQSKKKPK